MFNSFTARAAGAGLILALGACAQQATVSGQGPAASMPQMKVPQVQVPQMRMPQLRLPWGGGTAASPAAGGASQVVDPFAGQGVAQPNIPASGKVAATPAATPAPAAAPAAAAPAAPATSAARSHTVESGETAWSISRKYGVSVQALAAANGLGDAMSVRQGQRLAIPAAGAAVAANVVTAPGAGSPTPQPPSAARPLPNERTTPASTPAPKTDAPDLGKTRTAASGSGRLSMPASGSIVRAYAKGKNEGIDISAAPGSNVKAASSGTVAAVTRDTSGVPIVVVRHSDGLMTVYTGMDNLSVAKGDSVKSGQTLGKARSSGVVHFEVRKGFDSVDPEKYLK